VVGPSGSGKTTLLNAVLGAVTPDAGSIRVNGVDVARCGRKEIARLRANVIGVVFQHGELIGELTPVQNVVLPALIAGRDKELSITRAIELLDSLGVPTGRTAVDQLSGGERQRTALARALINEPAVILADEPTGSLDSETRDSVAQILFSAPAIWGCGLIVVTHDDTVAARADSVLNISPIAHAHV
jgi:ABC-type lipoprotein export system ATPase subunit